MIKNVVILLFWLFCAQLIAQDLIHYSTKNGLPSNHVYDIAQDSDGFMWFATNQGLVKFDGINFKTFTIQNGLPTNDTWKIESDFEGRIWYSSKSNYQGYIKNDSVYKFITPNEQVISPALFHKSNNGIWTQSSIGFLQLKNNKLQESFYSEYGGYETFERLIQENKSTYGQINIGLNPELKQIINTTKKEIIVLNNDLIELYRIKQELPDSWINEIIHLNLGLLPNHCFFRSNRKGILFINFKERTSRFFNFESVFGIKEMSNVFCESMKDEIQVCTAGHLIRFNYDFEILETISFPENLPNHRSFKDKDGNIWLADFSTGLTLFSNNQLQSNYYFRGNKIEKINMLDQNIIVGVYNDGFYNCDFKNNKFERLESEIPARISQIKYFEKERIGFAVSDRLTLYYHNNKFNQIFLLDSVSVGTNLKDVTLYNHKIYGVSSQQLLELNFDLQKSEVILLNEGMLRLKTFHDKLYIGCSNGLFLFNNETIISPQLKNKLLKIKVTCFSEYKDFLIVGTEGRGVFLYNEKEVLHLVNSDGLSVQKIILRNNRLWLASQKGVFEILLNNDDFTSSKIVNSYYESDGLLQNNVNDFYLKDSLLYVGSDIGLTKININSTVFKKDLKLFFYTKNDTLEYPYENSGIDVSFSVLDYINQKNFTFEYRLKPSQNDWKKTKTRTLNFNNLAPNFYTLEVKVIDNHNNQSIKRLYLNILPEWWQRRWAKIGYLLISLLFLWVVVRIIRHTIRKKERKAAQHDKQIAGLELRALRSQMNPHFVHNSLNAIQYYIQRNDIEMAEDYLEQFSTLIRMFFEYSRKRTISIADELELIRNYLEIEQLRFEEKLKYTITIDSKIDTEEMNIPSMILQPIIENAVNHGVFHLTTQGVIDITFSFNSAKAIQIEIQDNGIGVNQSEKMKLNSSSKFKSHSSTVLQERIYLLMQNNEWEIEHTIVDLSSLNIEASGTLVTLIFNQKT